MEPIKIAFFDAKSYDIQSFDTVNSTFGFSFKYFNAHLSVDTAILAKDFDVVCIFVNDPLTKETLDLFKSFGVKLIALRSAGYNNVDLHAAYKNLHVVRVPAYSPFAVAEHTVALMLALNRKIHRAYNRIHDNNFTISGLMGFDMHGKNAGIIGTGKIGKVLTRILTGFGMNILAYDPFPDIEFATANNVAYVDLQTLYRESDVISLNCPLNKETFHMINKEAIAEMKSGIMLINTGRGHLIDTQALIDGLKSQKIGSAGLDVYEEESKYFFEDFSNQILSDDTLARLLTFNNVLITSHQGFFTQEALKNIAETTCQNIKDFFDDKPLINEICYQCTESICLKEKTGRCF
ncbi:MAG: hydroxyacid dehydrogenase [Candidatus Marinimicrobia bacterium CG08_land_8_20_14_0_20_45_22]|nr:MAG: hydroxyacid dehydrogenase [Candidatus Marinimicrobia bacterium CG08_land_8_20_14_0_20_45_22]